MAYVRAKKSRRNKRINTTKPKLKAKKKRKVQLTGFAKPILEKTWDKKKTVHENFKSIGLVLNPNHAVPIPKTRKPKPLWKREMEGEPEEEEEVAFMFEYEKKKPVEPEPEPLPKLPTATVSALERLAGVSSKLERHVSPGEVDFIMKLVKVHGTDYKAMARDKRNHYQHTPKQLKRKVEAFLRSRQYRQAMELCRETVTATAMES